LGQAARTTRGRTHELGGGGWLPVDERGLVPRGLRPAWVWRMWAPPAPAGVCVLFWAPGGPAMRFSPRDPDARGMPSCDPQPVIASTTAEVYREADRLVFHGPGTSGPACGQLVSGGGGKEWGSMPSLNGERLRRRHIAVPRRSARRAQPRLQGRRRGGRKPFMVSGSGPDRCSELSGRPRLGWGRARGQGPRPKIQGGVVWRNPLIRGRYGQFEFVCGQQRAIT